ncbi:MAG: hypothetical protein DRP78_01210 [Candidatus Omnitrophota bacterium]|nr:MAG: hypothetical protein DRP78_01210 [Candidatus Omnitrophota bacterium]
MKKKNILIVDDDPIMRKSLEKALYLQKGYTVVTAVDGRDAMSKINQKFFDLVITDMKMPGIGGLELLLKLKDLHAETTVIVMTAYGTVNTAVTAMKNGAYDYLMKPFSVDEVEVVVQRAMEHRKVLSENRYLREEIGAEYNFGNIVGKSTQMQYIYDLIKKVSLSDATVLIQGESGTGKELVARALHYNSLRKNGPFIKVNCAALASSLLESELFGHEKGAFTNAYAKRLGRFELADKGTLFLDEISEMENSLQSKLLRVLQEGEFDRVGGSATIKTDVRIIATTNRNLSKEVSNHKFREDLYYRLNVIPIVLPSLRQRKEDILLLAEHFLDKYNRKNGKKISSISRETLDCMFNYNWPGNVRELENTLERAVVLSSGNEILMEHLLFAPAESKQPFCVPQESFALPVNRIKNMRETVKNADSTVFSLYEIEKKAIFSALHKCNHNKTKAAQLLGITVRTLRNKLKTFSQCIA